MAFIQDYATSERAVVLGATRLGKTEFIKRNIVPQIDRYIIYDPKHEYSGFGRCIHDINEFKGVKGLKIVFQPKPEDEGSFDVLCKFIFKNMGSVLLIIDEAHLEGVLNRHKSSKWCQRLIKMGAAAGKGIIAISQRPQDLHPSMRTQAEWIILFRLSLNDLEWCAKFMGDEVKNIENAPQYSHYEHYAGKLTFFNNS